MWIKRRVLEDMEVQESKKRAKRGKITEKAVGICELIYAQKIHMPKSQKCV